MPCVSEGFVRSVEGFSERFEGSILRQFSVGFGGGLGVWLSEGSVIGDLEGLFSGLGV